MAYFILLFILCAGVLLQQLFNDLVNRKVYLILFIILFGILVFRYGQGTDYFAYKRIYNQITRTTAFSSNLHTEFGFKVIGLVLKYVELPFEAFIGLFATLSMFLTHKAVIRFIPSKYSALFLLLLFPMIYLTYFFSGIRQGFVIALFLGVLLPALLEKSYLKYYLICILSVSIHTSAFILLFVPIVPFINRKGFLVLSLASTLFLVLSIITDLWQLVYLWINISYLGLTEFSIFGILDRLFMVLLIILLSKEEEPIPVEIQMLIKIYYIGFCIALALGNIPLFSQRLTAPIKAIEILLLPNLLHIRHSNSKVAEKNSIPLLIFVLFLYSFVFTAKNINAFIFQQGYVDTSIFNYPYISIFNKGKILNVLPGMVNL